MADYYREQVSKLNLGLRNEVEGKRMEAAEALRALISGIVLTASDTSIEVKLEGDLAGILNIAARGTDGGVTVTNIGTKRKKPPFGAACLSEMHSQLYLVAGARNNRQFKWPIVEPITLHIK